MPRRVSVVVHMGSSLSWGLFLGAQNRTAALLNKTLKVALLFVELPQIAQACIGG